MNTDPIITLTLCGHADSVRSQAIALLGIVAEVQTAAPAADTSVAWAILKDRANALEDEIVQTRQVADDWRRDAEQKAEALVAAEVALEEVRAELERVRGLIASESKPKRTKKADPTPPPASVPMEQREASGAPANAPADLTEAEHQAEIDLIKNMDPQPLAVETDPAIAAAYDDFAQLAPADLVPGSIVTYFDEATGYTFTASVVRHFEGTALYEVALKGAGHVNATEEYLRTFNEAPVFDPAKHEPPAFVVNETPVLPVGQDPISDSMRQYLNEESIRLKIEPARVKALMAHHFGKNSSADLTASEAGELLKVMVQDVVPF